MNELLNKFRRVWPHRLNDYLLVTLITVLIWVYAEGQNVRAYQPADRVPVTIELAADDLVVTDQSISNIGVEFSAATAAIDELRQLLGKRGIVLHPQITEPGQRTLALADELWQADPINQVSVNVNWTDPPTIDLTIDRLVERTVTVDFNPGDVKVVDGSVKIEPRELTLVAPERLLASLGVDDSFTVEAEPLTPIRSLAPGVEKTVDARVKLPPELAESAHVRLLKSDVKLTLTIDKAEETIILPNVPVWIAAPPGALADYSVKLHEDTRVLADVKVTGPPDMVARVQDGRIKIIAVLRLTSDRLAAGAGKELTETVSIEAPAPLVVEAPSATVRFSVTRNPTPSTSTTTTP